MAGSDSMVICSVNTKTAFLSWLRFFFKKLRCEMTIENYLHFQCIRTCLFNINIQRTASSTSECQVCDLFSCDSDKGTAKKQSNETNMIFLEL